MATWIRGPLAELAAVSAGAIVLTVVMAAPVIRAPSDRIFGNPIVGRHHDPFTAMEQFARPIGIGVYSQPLTDIPGALLARALGPVAAYNWLVLLTFPLSAVAAYFLARHLALSPVGAGIAAMAFAFSPFHLAHAAYHPHVAQTQWLPIYLLAVWRCMERSTPAAICLVAASTAGVTLSNFYGGLIAAVITPVVLFSYWWFLSRRHTGSQRSLLTTVASLVVVAGIGVVYAAYAAHAAFANPTEFAFPRRDLFLYSAEWWSFFVPAVGHPLFGEFAANIWNAAGVRDGLLEQQVSVGWGVSALTLVATGAWFSRARPGAAIATVPVLVAVGAAAFACSLSPEGRIGSVSVPRPSALLYELVPMFRSYARFGVVVQLAAALLAGLGVEFLWRSRGRWPRIVCVALLALATCEYAVLPSSLWRDVLPTPAHRRVVANPAWKALDCYAPDPETASVEWLAKGRIAPLRGHLDDCLEPNLPDKLAASGFTHLLVRHGSAEARGLARASLPDGLRREGAFRQADLFAVTTPPPSVYTAAFIAFSPREINERTNWRWMGADAFWTIVNRRDRRVSAALDIELWAFAYPRRLELRFNGRTVQSLLVDPVRRTYRLEPFTVEPGAQELVFHPAEPPTPVAGVLGNDDDRSLSFAVGSWRWSVEESPPLTRDAPSTRAPARRRGAAADPRSCRAARRRGTGGRASTSRSDPPAVPWRFE
jgi:hypothetical protein